MDHDREIRALAAETLAFSCVLQGVLGSLLRAQPQLRVPISEGFENALGLAQAVAMQFGTSASPEHTVKCVRIIEELRDAILGPPGKPRHGV
jgi:hypothetical protein